MRTFSPLFWMPILVCILVSDTISAQTCQLFVEQPTGAPTVTRAGGNTVWGQGSLRLTSPASGDWLVYLWVHLKFRAQGAETWSEVNYSEQATSIPNGTATGFTYSAGLVQATLQPRGNGDYQTTITSHGGCGGQDNPLTPQNPAPSEILSVSRPTLDALGLNGIWWFGVIGKEDATNGYYSSALIKGTPNWNGTLTYTISQGSDKVQLTCTNCNDTVAQAKAPSGGCTQDVIITASAGGFLAAAPVRFCVNRPAGRYSSSIYSNIAASGGYWSKDYFTFTELCSLSMSTVAYHEKFPGGIKSFWPGGAGSYWTGAPASAGWSKYRNDDTWVTYDDIVRSCVDAGCSPQTVTPSRNTLSRGDISSLMQDPIVALQQMWYVGDSQAGTAYGFLANQCNHTLYQDHGEDINYW